THDLDDSLGGSQYLGLSYYRNGKAAYPHIITPVARPGLGQTYACHLGRTIRAVGNVIVVKWLGIPPGNRLDRENPLRRRHVSQQRRWNDVADGIDAGLRRSHMIVSFDEPALNLNSGIAESQSVSKRPAPDGHKQFLSGELAILVAGPRDHAH